MSPSVPTQPDPVRARYEALLEVAESIAAHQDLASLLADLARCLRGLVSFDFIGLTMLDEVSGTVSMHVLEPSRETTVTAVDEADSLTGLALRTRQPVLIPDLSLEDRFPTIRPLLEKSGVRCACTFPLMTARRAIGGLQIGTHQLDAYTTGEIEFMRRVAGQVAIAVENALNHDAARAYEAELAHERDRARTLLEINNAVVSCLTGRDLFQAISDALRRTVGQDYTGILIAEPDGDNLRLRLVDDPDGKGLIRENATIPIEDSLAGHIMQARAARIVGIEEAQIISARGTVALAREGLRSMCLVPLITHDRVLGVLNLAARSDDFFHEEDIPFLTQAGGQIAIAMENYLSYRRIEELNERLSEEKVYLEDEIRTDNRFEDIVGDSPALRAILKQVATVAPTDSTVLVFGETGTGKELLARAVHELSPRSQGTFVKLNCAAIPTGLLESEMFGHEKGAFTGAIAQRIGRFELAHRGTIFLDEVGEIPLELQTKLLRVLQEREFERLGSSRTIRTGARLVAATNRDLAAMVDAREFRADLYYRLNVFPVTVPPLRDRREDIPLLIRYFVQQFARRMNRRISSIPSPAMNAMTRYDWPGNIRELQNFIERAVILTSGPTLQAPISELKRTGKAPGPVVTLAAAERDAILRALRESEGRVGGPRGAAARLGLKRTTLQARMRKLEIHPKEL